MDTIGCSREVVGASKVMKLNYWVNLEGDMPTFHGHLEYLGSKTLTGSSSTEELRLCLEFAVEGSEFAWREQLMFHATIKDKQFDKVIKTL